MVRVDGRRVNVRSDLVYLALNKPRGVLTAMSDPHGRPASVTWCRDRPERLFHVGRLDADTEGLLILTNDGDFAHRLAHPSHGVVKTYIAEVPGPVERAVGPRLRAGVELDDGPVRGRRLPGRAGHRRTGPWSRCRCTRAATTSCAGCWMRSGIRSAGWCGPRSGRCGWAISGRARCGS